MGPAADLPDVCRALGAVLASGHRPGQSVASWAEEAAEYEALRGGCGVALWGERERLDLTGEDRRRFLHGLVTFDVQGVATGGGGFGFFTDIHGKILADAALLAGGGRLRLELPAGRAEAIAEHLAKYKIADRVEIERPEDEHLLLLAGPRAAEAAAALAGEPPPVRAWSHAAVTTAEGPARIWSDGRHDPPAFGVAAPVEVVAGWLRRIAEGRLAGARPVGWRALETVRVEDGRPAYDSEYAGDAFPQETGLEGAVSYEKGCYLGQEVVARIHYRGKVNRQLRGLLLAAGPGPAPGAVVSFEGRPAGALGAVVDSPRAGGPAALALLHRRAADPGTRVEIAGGADGEVVELPLR